MEDFDDWIYTIDRPTIWKEYTIKIGAYNDPIDKLEQVKINPWKSLFIYKLVKIEKDRFMMNEVRCKEFISDVDFLQTLKYTIVKKREALKTQYLVKRMENSTALAAIARELDE
jgi:hypothetical protein